MRYIVRMTRKRLSNGTNIRMDGDITRRIEKLASELRVKKSFLIRNALYECLPRWEESGVVISTTTGQACPSQPAAATAEKRPTHTPDGKKLNALGFVNACDDEGLKRARAIVGSGCTGIPKSRLMGAMV